MRSLAYVLTTTLLLFIAGGSLAGSPAESDGQAQFQRCAACHMADGSGVTGIFPPLKERVAAIAAVEEGREYLILTVQYGLAGAIEIAGIPYTGAMPGQGHLLGEAGVASVLNYSVNALGGDKGASVEPFAAGEVAKILAANPDTDINAVKIKRERLMSLYQELQ